MKKLILEALKTKFEGVSESILNRVAEKLAKTVDKEEDVTAEIEGVTFQQVLESYGDSRATEASQTAVTNYEKKHGLKDGVKKKEQKTEKESEEEKKDESKKGDAESKVEHVPEWAKTLISSNKALEKRLENIEGEKIANDRKSTLSGILKDAPEKIKQRYEKDFERMNFTDNEDFLEWAEEIKPDIEELTAEFNAKGAVVGRPKSGGARKEKEGEVSSILKERIKSKKAENPTPAILGLEQKTE